MLPVTHAPVVHPLKTPWPLKCDRLYNCIYQPIMIQTHNSMQWFAMKQVFTYNNNKLYVTCYSCPCSTPPKNTLAPQVWQII